MEPGEALLGGRSDSREIRACLVVGQLGLGGLEKQAYLLATGLARREFDVSVISLSAGGAWAERFVGAGLSLIQLERRGHLEIRRLFALVRALRTIRPDLVYSFNYPTTVYARLAGLLASVPVLITGERCVSLRSVERFLERMLVRVTECVICNAEAVLRDRVDRFGLPAHKVITIYNGVEPGKQPGPCERGVARKALGLGKDSCVVGTIARLDDDKNLSMMIEVAALCRGEAPQVRFCAIGGGPREDSLRAEIRERGLEDVFLLAGPRESAHDLLPAFDIFVLTSRSEGLPNAVMEAMVSSLPCVCTDVGGCRELVEEGLSGYLVPAGDSAAMAGRVRELLRNPGLRERMGSRGRDRILKDFSVARLVERTDRVLREILDARRYAPRGHGLTAHPVTTVD
jgi:glycosyltransferase involved in cell wall biosynthesis